jgi:hypothetical protein
MGRQNGPRYFSFAPFRGWFFLKIFAHGCTVGYFLPLLRS